MTRMPGKPLVAGLLAIMTMAGPASAAVTYTFAGRAYDGGPDAVPTFTFTLPTFASSSGTTTVPASSLTSCSVAASTPTTCGSVELMPNFFSLGNDALFFYSRNAFGQGTTVYNFALNAFGAFGSYDDVIQRGNGQVVKATLTVSGAGSTGAVPEPATWAMLILGFGCVGAAMRRAARQKGRRPVIAVRDCTQ